MAYPASAVPPGNSYTLHCAGALSPASAASAESFGPITWTAAAAAVLLASRKIAVRRHLAGDGPDVERHRELAGRAGAGASAFSPAPSPELPGEGFWKTTVAVVESATGAGLTAPRFFAENSETATRAAEADFWWPPRAERKVEWDCLLAALRRAGPEGLPAGQVSAPDLWIAATPGEAPAAAEEWLRAGAGAAAVIGRDGIAWRSRNAAFGNSAGERPFPARLADGAVPDHVLAGFAAGLLRGLFDDLLGDSLFEKTLVRVERECLEARPLRLGPACAAGGAAARVLAAEDPGVLLRRDGPLPERVDALLRAETPVEPTARPWGSKGR